MHGGDRRPLIRIFTRRVRVQAAASGRLSQDHGQVLRAGGLHCQPGQGGARFPFLLGVFFEFLTCPVLFLSPPTLATQYANPVMDKLDKSKVVSHRLFRESCANHAGSYVKVRA